LAERTGKSVFSSIDLDEKLDQATYNSIIPDLRERLGELQRKAKDAGVPIIIIFEGWAESGKGIQMNKLLMGLDPRGFRVYAIDKPMDAEKVRPFFWRYWIKTPQKGQIVILSKSWYGQTLARVFDGKMGGDNTRERYQEANLFEKTLTDDECLIIKLFLHIGKKVQRSRLVKKEKDPAASWLVTKADLKQNDDYKKYLDAAEDMVSQTDTIYAPWNIIEAEDRRFATVKIYNKVIAAMEQRLQATGPVKPAPVVKGKRERILENIDLSGSLEEDEYKVKLDALQDRLKELQYTVYKQGLPVVFVFEGWDAAGKDGGIRRLTENMDPRGYQVNSYGVPNDVEKSHNYLWRFWKEMPADGNIAIFDRSWYGRVLVERVEGFCTPAEWSRAYGEINEMERELAERGAVIVKFWLHISWDEQLKRFERRELDPFKNYKITGDDWRNRDKWEKYVVAADQMFVKTNTDYAPWVIVGSNYKRYARIKILETAIAAIDKKIKT
jgi:polyphosphate:AMP phosphotransferase